MSLLIRIILFYFKYKYMGHYLNKYLKFIISTLINILYYNIKNILFI